MKRTFQFILLTTLFLWTTAIGDLVAQNNTKFWFAAPDVSYAHGPGCDFPVSIVISNANYTAAKVTIRAGSEIIVSNQIVDPNAVYVYTTPDRAALDKFENSVAEGIAGTVQNKGVLIESDIPISAYYVVDGSCSKDIFTLKSDQALGDKFYVPMQDLYVTYSSDVFDQITIVATEDNTVVKATVTGAAYTPGKIYYAGETITINLNKGQTYNIREKDRDQNPSLAGTYIESTKPIAVTVAEDALRAGDAIDLIGDQLVPVNNVGTSYVVINGYTEANNHSTARDYVYMFATEDNTAIYENGSNIPVATIPLAGAYYRIQVPKDQAIYIRTDKPSYCYHMSGYNDELGSALIPSMYSISARKISFNKANMSTNAIFLIFRTGKVGQFKITDKNGVDRTSSVTITPESIIGMPDWQYAKVDISTNIIAPGQCTIENSESAFALGYFNYDGGTASYGFLSGFGDFSISDRDTIYVCESSYTLDAGYARSYKWELPDGSIQTTSTIIANQNGKYVITVDQDPKIITQSVYIKFQNYNNILQVSSVGLLDVLNKFSVQLNPQNDPNNVYNAKYEWTFGGDANISNANTAEVTGVKWASLGEKAITLKISNLDASCDTTITRKIRIINAPDNMNNDDCWITPIAKDWTIKESANYNGQTIPNWNTLIPNGVNSMSTPLVADLDGDGIPEIIVPIVDRTNAANPWNTNGLLIVNAKNKTERVITVADFSIHGQSIAIADVDKDGKGEIFLQGSDGKIYAYDYLGNLKYSTIALPNHYIIQIADLNNDGNPELIAGNYIFNAQTGALLLNFALEADGTGYGNPHRMGAGPSGRYYMPAIGDVDGDGDLEIVAGSTVYDVYIAPNSNSTVGNSLVKKTKVDTSGLPADFKKYLDGATVLVDFNLDGQLDVCVIGTRVTATSPSQLQFYVWNPTTRKVVAYAPELATPTSATIPYVGDLDGNGYPDFAFAVNDAAIGMISYQYDNTKNGNILVGKNKPEFAETAGFTMFDFNQDGKSEIVYRGNKEFYIVDGITLENLSTPMTSYSGTITEYPIVADVDGDGQAEIILTRSIYNWHGGQTNATGLLSIYKSGDGTNNPWAPARKVWNQWSYNAANINEDLTVPQYQINPSTVFSGKDDSYNVRPFNGYLQQQTALSKAGVPLFLTPNAQIKDPENIEYRYTQIGDSLVISNLQITNVGSAPLNAPIKIAVYKDQVPNYKKFVYTYPKTIEKNDTHTISFAIPNFSSWSFTNDLIIRVNDNGDGYNNQPVCDSCCNNSNSDVFVNMNLYKIAWADSYRKCIGEPVQFLSESYSGDSMTYKWVKPDGVQLATTQNTSINNLNLNQAGRYTFTVTNVKNSKLTLEAQLPYLSVAPDTLYWREDAMDANWNNLRNWSTSASKNDSIWAVPAPCTTVHMIGGASIYPSLNLGYTDTTYYSTPHIKDIIYHYGSETRFPNRLNYQRAFIQYNFGYYKGVEANGDLPTGNIESSLAAPVLKRNRWYLLATPLKSVATGDFSFAGYPLTWQSKFDATALGNNSFKTPFATNDIPTADNNHAIALKVAPKDSKIGYSQRDLDGLKGVLTLPFFEDENTTYHSGHSYNKVRNTSNFYYFNVNTLEQIYNPVGSLKRGQEAYRFIYEDDNNKPTTIFLEGWDMPGYTITVSGSSSTNNQALIGNPLMSSISAKQFYEINKDAINGTTYQVFDGTSWQSFNYADNSIAPLQAFLVTLKTNTETLLFPFEGVSGVMNQVTKAEVLLSPMDDESSLFIRSIDQNNTKSPYAVLTVNEEMFPKTQKLMDENSHTTPEAFFIADDTKNGNLFDIYQKGMKKIGIAVRSSNTDDITTLDFENVADFAYNNNTRPVLLDKVTGMGQDLLEKNSYDFNQQKISKEDGYTDYNRFEIRFLSEDSNIDEDQNIKITFNNDLLEVSSKDPLSLIEMYDMLGRSVYNSGKLSASTIMFSKYITLPDGVYIIKVKTADGNSISKKIMNVK